MEMHYAKHQQSYVNNLKAALERSPHASQDVDRLVACAAQLPENLQTVLRNNGGGHANHSLFWSVMSPRGGGTPSGALSQAIDTDLGGFEKFKDAFTRAALTRFGSGLAWLSVGADGKLVVEASANQDSPLMAGWLSGNTPMLDVWEHAYYRKYQNRRPEYIQAFFNVVDWNEVARRFAGAGKPG